MKNGEEALVVELEIHGVPYVVIYLFYNSLSYHTTTSWPSCLWLKKIRIFVQNYHERHQWPRTTSLWEDRVGYKVLIL